ncbi:MAG: hypothetical protein HN394_22920, partial [Rhodospirillaceae bacterium]|nr:hypothetical protein [Rhodospirillaceae bacterium]
RPVNSDRSDNDSGTALGFFNANATTQMSWFTLDYTSNTWGSIALTYRAGSYTAVSLPVEFTSSNTDNTVKYLGNDLFIYFATGSIGMARWDGTTFKELGHLALNWRYHGGMVNGAIISVTATEVHGFVTSGNTSPGALQTELYAKPFVLFLNDDDQITGFLGVEHHLTDGLTGNFSMPHVIVPETANATATFIFLDGNVASSVAFRKLTQA